MTRQRAYQLRHRKQGRCEKCPLPICPESSHFCEIHRILHNIRCREAQRKRHGYKRRYLVNESYLYG